MNTIESPRAGVAAKLESMPLAYIPLERGHTSLEKTAGHELNHALAGIQLGATVIAIDMRRRGNILASTSFAGDASKVAFQAIAAAGSVHTHLGEASGYGSDLQKAYYLEVNGGNSVSSARGLAAKAIGKYPTEVRAKASEIIAYLGVRQGIISGSMLPSILDRARFEVGLKKEDIPSLLVSKQTEPEENGYTEIRSLENGDYIIAIVTDTKEEEQLVCGSCHEIDGHSGACSKNNDSKFEKDEDIKNYKPLPRQDTIFSRS